MDATEESIRCAEKVLDVYTKQGFDPRTALMLTLKDLMIYCQGQPKLNFDREFKHAKLNAKANA